MRKLAVILSIFLVACAEERKDNIIPLELTDKDSKNIEYIYESYLETLESYDDEGGVLEASDEFSTFNFSPSTKKQKKWELTGMKTILAKGLSGEIGVLSWGGSRTAELIWKRIKNDSSANMQMAEESQADITINTNSEYEDMQNQLEPLIQTMVRTGKVENESNFRSNLYEASDRFYQMSKAMDIDDAPEWWPYKMRLDLTVSVSGDVGAGIVIKAGLDTRVRLEWVRLEKKSSYRVFNKPAEKDPVVNKVQELLSQMAVDLSAAASSEEAEIKKWRAKVFRVGIGITAKGDVGVISTKFGYTPYVYFKRGSGKKPAQRSIAPMSIHPEQQEMDDYLPVLALAEGSDANDNGVDTFGKSKRKKKTRVLKVKRKKLRKGINKAIKYGHKMGKKLKSKKYKKNKKWEVKTLKVGYKFSLNGDIGSVNVKTEPNIEIEYERIAQ